MYGAVSTAKDNVKYFYDVNRGVSAHYFVDEKEIWQCVDDSNVAWHCGNKTYYHDNCRNGNSIGIEICCKKDKNGNWYFEKQAIENAIWLTRLLMEQYGIPAENVLRHYDVTRKICPEPFVKNKDAWEEFKRRINVKKIETVKDALDFLVEKGRVDDRAYWEKAILTTRNIDFLFTKWANDVKTLVE